MSEEEKTEELPRDDRPQSTEMENIFEQATFLPDRQAITNQQSTQDMEVHKHPHHVTHKKKWGEYLLEFFMLFLAVFLGFLAENFREHSVERHREKEYMHSLLEDLKYDTSKYHKVINEMELLQPALDSAYINVTQAARFNYVLQGKWQFAINEISTEYIPGLPTIQQMKSSGNLRLIENREVENKIMEYESFVKTDVERLNANIHAASGKVWAMEDKFCDYMNFRKINIAGELNLIDTAKYEDWNMPILEKDRIKLNEFANSFINYKNIGLQYIKTVQTANKLATRLFEIIKKEYHLKNE